MYDCNIFLKVKGKRLLRIYTPSINFQEEVVELYQPACELVKYSFTQTGTLKNLNSSKS